MGGYRVCEVGTEGAEGVVYGLGGVYLAGGSWAYLQGRTNGTEPPPEGK